MIKLRLFSKLRDIAGSKEVEVEGDGVSIKDALEKLVERFGGESREVLFNKEGELWPSVLLLVNGEAVTEGAATAVKSGDTVAVLLPTAGG
jgi:MoaD family protein